MGLAGAELTARPVHQPHITRQRESGQQTGTRIATIARVVHGQEPVFDPLRAMLLSLPTQERLADASRNAVIIGCDGFIDDSGAGRGHDWGTPVQVFAWTVRVPMPRSIASGF